MDTIATQHEKMEEALGREQELLRQLLEFHERDRQRLALELHDDLAQQLTGALMALEGAWQLRASAPKLAEDSFRRGGALLRQSIEQSRKIVSRLRPPVLDEFGIVSAIETLVSQHQVPGGPTIRFVCRGGCRRLTPPMENGIYRIVQEVLTNACRHSRSNRIRIELACGDRHVRVAVQDWGVGFVPDRTEESYSGLKDVRERARLFGGKAVLETAPGRGTRVTVRLPLVTRLSQRHLTVPRQR